MPKITIVKQIPKDSQHYTSKQTNRTTYKYNHKTVGTLTVTENDIKLLKAQDTEALANLREVLISQGHEKGIYNIREVLGGCRRFRKEKGFRRIAVIEI